MTSGTAEGLSFPLPSWGMTELLLAHLWGSRVSPALYGLLCPHEPPLNTWCHLEVLEIDSVAFLPQRREHSGAPGVN